VDAGRASLPAVRWPQRERCHKHRQGGAVSAPLLIGLTGPAGAGKDSVAWAIGQHINVAQVAFADALREEVCAAFQVPMRYLTTQACKEIPIRVLSLDRCMNTAFVTAAVEALSGVDMRAPRSPRQIMQLWGTEYRRNQAEDYWLQRASKTIAGHLEVGTSVVVTDVRFANEAALIRAAGGHLWRVSRPGYEIAPGAHASETTGDGFGAALTVLNDGTLDELQHSVRSALAMTLATRRGAGEAV